VAKAIDLQKPGRIFEITLLFWHKLFRWNILKMLTNHLEKKEYIFKKLCFFAFAFSTFLEDFCLAVP